MKRINLLSVIVTTIFMLGGCRQVDYYQYSCNIVDNQSSHSFKILVESSLQDMLNWKNIPAIKNIPSNNKTEWISMSSKTEGMNPVYNENITFTFVFENGVHHINQGELTDNDFRDLNSWICKKEGAKGIDEGCVYQTYTYTFTQEDYEEIMALYK